MNNNQICNIESCTGCLACFNSCVHHAVKLSINEEGFIQPYIDTEKCIDCGLCRQRCPSNGNIRTIQFEQYGYVCWNKDSTIVRNSSSGGLFTSLAESIIKDGGYVCGAAFSDNFEVSHVIINNITDLQKIRCSKYVQSNIGYIYWNIKQLLVKKKIVLFVGTPCQVAGLKNFLCIDYPNLYTCDFVCHGVPSPKIFKTYKEYLENKYKSKWESYVFRDKRWSWASFNIKATFKNGNIYYGTWYKDPFLRLFLSELISRESCYSCNYTNMNRPGDITFADFWGIKFHQNEKKNYNDTGLSLALINSEKGKELFEKSKKTLIYYRRSKDEIRLSQKSFNSPWSKPKNRSNFWEDYRNENFEFVIKKYAKELPTPLNKRLLFTFGKNKFISFVCKIIDKLIIG